jgi:pyrroline-5-carboxylate reductase
VKPNNVLEACSDIRKIPSEALIISIAAGITLDKLEEALPNRRVVRVMPNTPCLVGYVSFHLPAFLPHSSFNHASPSLNFLFSL